MSYKLQDTVIVVFGFISTVLTVAIIIVMEKYTRFSSYSLMLWFVIPTGAILSGFVAASGYYIGFIFFAHKPTSLLIVSMITVSTGAYFSIYWFSYVLLEYNGENINNVVSFGQYINSTLQIVDTVILALYLNTV